MMKAEEEEMQKQTALRMQVNRSLCKLNHSHYTSLLLQ